MLEDITIKEKKVFKVCGNCSEYLKNNAKSGQCLLDDKRKLKHWSCPKWTKGN